MLPQALCALGDLIAFSQPSCQKHARIDIGHCWQVDDVLCGCELDPSLLVPGGQEDGTMIRPRKVICKAIRRRYIQKINIVCVVKDNQPLSRLLTLELFFQNLPSVRLWILPARNIDLLRNVSTRLPETLGRCCVNPEDGKLRSLLILSGVLKGEPYFTSA